MLNIDKVGLITAKDIDGIKVNVKIIKGKGIKNARTFKVLKSPYYIVVHNTGNSALSADDISHNVYLQNVENSDNTYVSWHFTVDCDSITQNLPIFEQGYHAGDGNGLGNSNGIAIEICENKDYAKAEANAIKLIIFLKEELNIEIQKVKPHRFFASNKKLCPHKILVVESQWEANWNKFIKRVELEESNKGNNGTSKVLLDNTPDSWAKTSIERAITDGILRGDSNGNLKLHETRTTQDIIVLMYRFIEKYIKS